MSTKNNNKTITSQKKSVNWDQPDNIYQLNVFEPYMNSEQTRPTRQYVPQQKNLAQSYNYMQSQNHIKTQDYQLKSMQIVNALPFYLQQHEISKSNIRILYLMGGSSITSNKPLMLFTGTNPGYSVEDYLHAVTINLISNIDPEPIIIPFNQKWIHMRTALIQTHQDGTAQSFFSVLPIKVKSH